MSDELFDDAGPEGRNQRGADFEDQLVGMGVTLGWVKVCRNIDIFVKNKPGPSRGIDVLWSVRNPQTERKEGWVEEGKSHETPAPSKLGSEIQILHDKVARFQGLESFHKHPEIRRHVNVLVGGILAHHSNGFDPEKAREALLNFEPRNKQRGIAPIEILFYGPDSLEALADAIRRTGAPDRFFWPPTDSHARAWSKTCPPRQIAAGLLAYKSTEGKTVLWLRDRLVHHDLAALAAIVHAWGINVDVVVCSQLDRNQLRIVADAWARTAQETQERRHGRLPDVLDARDLGLDRMNNFDDTWPAAA